MNAKTYKTERSKIAELQARYDLSVRFVDTFWILEGERLDEALNELRSESTTWQIATDGTQATARKQKIRQDRTTKENKQ